MERIVKHFSELTKEELYEIYKVRAAVFVVEQNCPYQDIDDADKESYHIWLKDDEGIQAYARVLPQGAAFSSPAIGRVLSRKRRCGLGTDIVKAAIDVAKERYHADLITIEAQVYARSLYEKLGFCQSSEEFLEDGIPHIQMQLKVSR